MSLSRRALPPPFTGAADPLPPRALESLMAHLGGRGSAALAAVPRAVLLEAWAATVASFRDPRHPLQQRLRPVLADACGLSRAGLDAALEVVLEGVSQPHAERLFARTDPPGDPVEGPAWVVLAGNIPGLAAQTLLPALATGRPALLKSASREPFFAPAFVATLGDHEPRLRDAVAALAWPGGDHDLDEAAARSAARVVAYGGDPAIEALRARARAPLIGHGAKHSVAVVGRDVVPAEVAAGLARDVALFDQRGCLSIRAVFTAGDAVALAEALAAALRTLATRWPPGPVEPATALGVQRWRALAALGGHHLVELPLACGTVAVLPPAALAPGPGSRSVAVHPVPTAADAASVLERWHHRLQGVALAGEDAWALAPTLRALGATRLASPGELQAADATWANGGIEPWAAYR